MEEQNDTGLDMSLFNSDGIELNMEGAPDDVKDFLNTEEKPPEETETDKETVEEPEDINAPDEDESPEDVVGEEGLEDGSDDDDATSPNLFSSFASELHSEGLLPSIDLENTEIKDINDLANVFKTQMEAQTKEYLVNKLGEEGYDALEKGVSLAEYQAYQQRTTNLESITDEVLEQNIELAKEVILQDYINQGLDPDRAKRILAKTIDLGEDQVLADAKESMESLKKFEALKLEHIKAENEQRQLEMARQQEKIDNDLKNAIYKTQEIIKGLPITKQMQDQVYKSITTIVDQAPGGVNENKLMSDRRKDPINFDTKLYYIYELTKGFEDFSMFGKAEKKKAVSDFEKALKQARVVDNGNPSYTQDPESYGGIGSEIVI